MELINLKINPRSKNKQTNRTTSYRQQALAESVGSDKTGKQRHEPWSERDRKIVWDSYVKSESRSFPGRFI